MKEQYYAPAASSLSRYPRRPLGELVHISVGNVTLSGELELRPGSKGLVIFAHGSGSSRHSPRNQFVARALREAESGTLLFDLLTSEEEAEDAATGSLHFDIGFLAQRLVQVTLWVLAHSATGNIPIGYFGASTGAAAALAAAGELGSAVGAVVSCGGRPDLAREALPCVTAPTLLIVGGEDAGVLKLNRQALAQLCCEKELLVIPGTTHLFWEPGALESVSQLAAEWFQRAWHHAPAAPLAALRP